MARDLAGFTPGQGEQLRRALGGKRGPAEVEAFRAAFLAGALANGVSLATAETVFGQLQAFGGYSFARSHAAAFAVLVYQSAWLKCYHPAAFFCVLLNNQPMGFWSPAVLVGDARRRGLAILPVDIQRSLSRCTVEGAGIRLGFSYVSGIGAATGARLEAARKEGEFAGLADLCRRTRLPRRLVEGLILAGAMDGWDIPRRKLLWGLGRLAYREEELDLVFPADDVELPPLSRAEAFSLEWEVLGLSTGEHVLAFYRPWLRQKGILGSWDLAAQPAGRQIRIAGQVVVHQSPPTAKGHHFLTLEDEAGLVQVILRPPVVTQIKKLPSWQGYGLNDRTLVLVEGTVQRDGNIVNILAIRIHPFTDDASLGLSLNPG